MPKIVDSPQFKKFVEDMPDNLLLLSSDAIGTRISAISAIKEPNKQDLKDVLQSMKNAFDEKRQEIEACKQLLNKINIKNLKIDISEIPENPRLDYFNNSNKKDIDQVIETIVKAHCPNIPTFYYKDNSGEGDRLSHIDKKPYIKHIKDELGIKDVSLISGANNKYYALLEHCIVKHAQELDKKVLAHKKKLSEAVSQALGSSDKPLAQGITTALGLNATDASAVKQAFGFAEADKVNIKVEFRGEVHVFDSAKLIEEMNFVTSYNNPDNLYKEIVKRFNTKKKEDKNRVILQLVPQRVSRVYRDESNNLVIVLDRAIDDKSPDTLRGYIKPLYSKDDITNLSQQIAIKMYERAFKDAYKDALRSDSTKQALDLLKTYLSQDHTPSTSPFAYADNLNANGKKVIEKLKTVYEFPA